MKEKDLKNVGKFVGNDFVIGDEYFNFKIVEYPYSGNTMVIVNSKNIANTGCHVPVNLKVGKLRPEGGYLTKTNWGNTKFVLLEERKEMNVFKSKEEAIENIKMYIDQLKIDYLENQIEIHDITEEDLNSTECHRESSRWKTY